MNSQILHRLTHIPLKLRGLYTPESRQGASENVLCADGIGIGGVTTMPTQKLLSLAVVLVHRTTLGKVRAGLAGLTRQAEHGSLGRVWRSG